MLHLRPLAVHAEGSGNADEEKGPPLKRPGKGPGKGKARPGRAAGHGLCECHTEGTRLML